MFPERQSVLSRGIGGCQSRSDLLECWRKAAREYGFSHVTLFTMPGVQDRNLAPLIQESTLPSEFCREFDRLEMLDHCPAISHYSRSITHLTWSIGPEGTNPDFDCPPPMAALFRRHGIQMGVTFGLASVDGSRFILRYDGARSPLENHEINELSVISTQAFDVFDRLRRKASNVNLLSARELEVVRWTAQGKTSLEIGQILSLSDHTVNAYMTNAIRKLDCVNRTQLVAKAIRMKIIS